LQIEINKLKEDNKYYKVYELIYNNLIQLCKGLNIIHTNCIIHRDIKPDNFLFGLKDKITTLHIIDFGFCKTFIKDDKHIPQKNTHNLIGSNTYASVNAHKFIELSRRDDLESLGYMLINLYLGSLPWQDITGLSNDLNGDIHKTIIKSKTHILETCSIPAGLTNYMKYVRNLEFLEKPNYTFLIDNFLVQIELLKKNS
jgi:serine/threonine protein kinase